MLIRIIFDSCYITYPINSVYDNICFFYFQYFHNGADTLSDKFTLVARTSTKTSVPATVNIQIIPVNDEVPRMVNNTGLEVWAGSSAVITTKSLSKLHFDTNIVPCKILY